MADPETLEGQLYPFFATQHSAGNGHCRGQIAVSERYMQPEAVFTSDDLTFITSKSA